MPETETADSGDFGKVFDAAVAEHSQEGEQADTDDTPENKPEEGDTESGEQQPPGDSEVADQGDGATDDDEPLLSAEEEAALEGKSIEEVRKGFQRAYTKKTMALAEQRKALEAERKAIESWRQAIELYGENPTEFIRSLAQRHGLTVSGGEVPRKETETPVADDFLKGLREDPELSFLADRLQPVFEAFEKRLTNHVLKTEIEPLKAAEAERRKQAVAAETEKAFREFGARHKGWEKYADKMRELSEHLQPAGNMTMVDYLEVLWKVVQADLHAVEATKKALNRVGKAIKAAEPPQVGVNEKNVTRTLPKNADFEERFDAAWDAALRGEVLTE